MKHLATVVALTVFLSLSDNSHAGKWEDVAEGGRLYDKWWVVYELRKPDSTHPAYPSKGKKSGATTWRCKECHGWDYRGKDGAYRKGSHFTGIKGIRKYAGGDSIKVVAILKNKTHQYDRVMLDPALRLIANFVVNGQVDTAKYIDDKTKTAKGNKRKGKKIFKKQCARCHDEDGRAMNFSSKRGEYAYIGTEAKKNPWEVLHKIRNAHPGAEMHMHLLRRGAPLMGMHRGNWEMHEHMPPMLPKLSLPQQIDLLTFTQTLPVK